MRSRKSSSRFLPTAAVLSFFGSAWAAPPLTVANISTARSDIRIWNVKAIGAARQGSTTSKEEGKLNVTHKDGKTTTHDATFKVESGTLFQDGEVCHNFGPKCTCGTTVFRLESGAAKWKFGTPSNNQPVACASGIKPTGDPEIKKSLTRADLEARKEQIRKERAAKK